ncbi:MAG: CocE/NonD family hydrolase [Roseicyclus sp.]
MSQTLSCGTTLEARVWRPDGGGPHPVLLMRQPYGAEIASTVTLAHPGWYAAQGFITVVQDVRGAGASEGVWDTLGVEAADGAEACAWARSLPGSSGRLGLYGFSYHGMTQMLALSGGGAADAIAPVMAPWDTRAQMATEGGAFRLGFNVGWAAQMAALQARRAGDGEAFAALRAAAMDPPVTGPMPGKPGFCETYRSWCHLADWVERQDDPAFWGRRSPARMARTAPEALRTPALFVGGWFDPFLEGTFASFEAFRAAGAPARMVVGAWSHLVWGGRSVDTLLVDHFRAHLAGGGDDAPALEWQDMTRGDWRAFDAPPTERVSFALGGTGLAAAASGGALVPGAAPDLSETFVHDPWRPVPARGLHLAPPFGLVDRADLDARADVTVFTSEPLGAPLRLAGPVALEVTLTADAPGFDVHLVLSRAMPDGRVTALTSGYHRLTDAPETLSLRPLCATLEPGERLRLSVAGAAWPAFAVNPGTGACPETTPAHEHRPITISLRGPAALSLTVAP